MADEIVAAAPSPEEIDAAKALLARAGLAPIVLVAAPEPLTAEEQAQDKGPCLAFRAWEKAQCAAVTTFWSTWNLAGCAARALKGLRTLLFFGVTGAGTLYSSIEGIDLSGVASKLTGLHLEYTDLMLGMSIVGIGLRLLTDSSAFKRWRAAARGDGVSPGVGSGDVDEPEENQ